MESIMLLFILLVQLYHFKFQQHITSKLSYFQESHLTFLVTFQIYHSIQHRKFYIQREYYYTHLKAVYFYISVHESHNINNSWQPATQVYLYWICMLKKMYVNKTQQSVYVFTFFCTTNNWQFIDFSSTFHRITTLIYCFLKNFVNWSTSMFILLYGV